MKYYQVSIVSKDGIVDSYIMHEPDAIQACNRACKKYVTNPKWIKEVSYRELPELQGVFRAVKISIENSGLDLICS